MTEISPTDLEELYTRRMVDRVVEQAEQTIRHRYLWINVAGGLAFMIVSWLGGAALLTDYVKASVNDQVKQQSGRLREVELETTASAATLKARLAQINDAMEEQRDRGKALDGKLKDAKDQAEDIEQKLGQIVGTTNSITKNSADIAVLRQSIEEVVKLSELVVQLQKRIAELAGASVAPSTSASTSAPTSATSPPPPQVQTAQAAQIAQSLSNASLQLGQATVFVQFSGSVSRAQIDTIRAALGQALSVSVPQAERVASLAREVRFFHKEDEGLAKSVAEAAQKALADSNIGNGIAVSVKPLLDFPKKPSQGVIELWLGSLPARGG